MKISTKGRYGLRAMVDLAATYQGGHVPLIQIADRQKISLNYLEQVFASLRKAGLVKSVKGAGGGYLLARDASEITVYDILSKLEGEYAVVDHSTVADDRDPVYKSTKRLIWEPIDTSVIGYLKSKTLADLVEEHNQLNNNDADIYYI